MKILKILLRNLHSLRTQVEIDFSANPLADSGLFAITGDTGAGKTTILDALTLALYGEICRGGKAHEALSYGASEGLAECVFEANGRRFLAKWNIRKTKSKKENNTEIAREVGEWDAEKGEFLIQAARRVTDVDKFIEQVTGLDFARFTRSVLLAQGDFAAFLKAPHRERSELLERITGTQIYSELSQKAYHRATIEEQNLVNLRTRQKALHVLTPEDLNEIKTQLEQAETESLQLNQQRLETAKSLQICLQIRQLEPRLQAVATQLSTLEQEKNQAQSDLDRLDLHRKTTPFQTQLHRLDDKTAEISSVGEAVGRLKTELAGLKTQVDNANRALAETTLNLKEIKALQAQQLQIFDRAAVLDAALELKLGASQKAKKDLAEQALELEKWQARQLDLEAESETILLSLTALENWLLENANYAGLTSDMPAIRLFRTQLGEVYKSKSAADSKRQSIENQLETARRQAHQARLDLQNAEALLAKSTELFNRQAPEDYVPSRQDLLEKLNKEIEALADREKNYRQLQAYDEEYSQLLQELSNLDEQLDLLQMRQEILDNDMLDLTENEALFERELQDRLAILRQQESIEKYQDDRAALPEGEPCPLCFSVHHPFREHDFQPFVSRARQDFEQAQLALNELTERKKRLLNRSFEVQSELNHQLLQKAKLQQHQDDCERKFKDVFPFALADEEHINGSWVAEKLADFERLMVSQKLVRENLLRLHRQLEQQEKQVENLAKTVREAEFEQQRAEQGLQHIEQTISELAVQFAAKNQELNDLVEKYGYRFVLGQTNGMFDELSQKEQDWAAKKSQDTEHRRRLELATQALVQTRQSLAEGEKKHATQLADWTAEEEKLTALKNERQQLFGDKNVAAERAAFLAELEAKEQAASAARTESEKIGLELSRCQLSLQTQLDRLQSGRKAQSEILADLNSKISKAGFADLEQLRSAMLPEEKAAQLADFEAYLRKKEMEFRQLQQGIEQELNDLRAAAEGSKPLEELQSWAAVLEENFQAIQQSIGRFKQQISVQNKVREEAENLSQQIENQRKTYLRWAALKELIGSSDGSKFRKFAQGLTMQKLVQLANLHLGSLSGRYRIRKRDGEDLELEIVDIYQAENRRSMHSLSGGESFLVSLALALGLSDLAGRDANIRSLFIDEGFGTLDDQALDVAISTLENLQATGKTIGVISHVKELKERIPTQIKVVKKGGGVSVVEVV